MPYNVPTLAEVSQSLRTEIHSHLDDADPWLRPNNLDVLVKSLAGPIHGSHLRVSWLHRQILAKTADTDALEDKAADFGLTRLPETFAFGPVSIVTVPGTVIPAAVRLLRGDGAAFEVLNKVTATGAATELQVKAVETGRTGNTPPGAPFTLESPIAGAGVATVGTFGLSGGADPENDASLLQRLLLRKSNPPHGGSPPEIGAWARQVPGVTRVYVKRATPFPGAVTVMFMMHDVYVNGIPLGGDLATMKAHLETEMRSSAQIIVVAPIPLPVNITITGLTPDTTKVREAIAAELSATFRNRAEPGTSLVSFVFSRSWIAEAISTAAGEARHTLTLPAADVTCGDGQIAVLGTVTYA